jgi:hypothetical protein
VLLDQPSQRREAAATASARVATLAEMVLAFGPVLDRGADGPIGDRSAMTDDHVSSLPWRKVGCPYFG